MSPIAEVNAATALNMRSPTDDEARNDWSAREDARDESLDRARSNDIDNLRQDLLKRESTRGRRRPGERAPPLLRTGSSGPGMILTQPSPRKDGFDEEANMGVGLDGRMLSGSGTQTWDAGLGSSYMALPPSSLQPGLQSSQTAPPNVESSRTEGLGRSQKRH